MGEADAEVVYNSIHISTIIDNRSDCKVADEASEKSPPGRPICPAALAPALAKDYVGTTRPGVTMPGPIV
jgi:hypothetical protein